MILIYLNLRVMKPMVSGRPLRAGTGTGYDGRVRAGGTGYDGRVRAGGTGYDGRVRA